jgi:hypothetical protein
MELAQLYLSYSHVLGERDMCGLLIHYSIVKDL